MSAFARSLLGAAADPRGRKAGLTNYLPLSGWSGWQDFTIEGRPPVTGAAAPSGGFQVASDDYFKAMGIRLIAGRTFTPRDNEGARPVVAINQTLASDTGRARTRWASASSCRQNRVRKRSRSSVWSRISAPPDSKSPSKASCTFPLAQTVSHSGPRLKTQTRSRESRGAAARRGLERGSRAAGHVCDAAQELAAESLAFRRAGMVLAGASARWRWSSPRSASSGC